MKCQSFNKIERYTIDDLVQHAMQWARENPNYRILKVHVTCWGLTYSAEIYYEFDLPSDEPIKE